jgi:prepilin-type N-terminal cleavage/methylation domain-containing protein
MELLERYQLKSFRMNQVIKKSNSKSSRCRNSCSKKKGFTLLEVLVSITLTALVLGNLFALQSQSKRLTFKAKNTLLKTINQRAYLNAAWLSNRVLDSYMDDFSESAYSVENEKKLKKPEEQNKPIKHSLHSFSIVNEKKEIILSSVRIQETAISRL